MSRLHQTIDALRTIHRFVSGVRRLEEQMEKNAGLDSTATSGDLSKSAHLLAEIAACEAESMLDLSGIDAIGKENARNTTSFC